MPDRSRRTRRRFDLRGQVQGVGFRPYVYRLALAHDLGGHVVNSSNGAAIEVEGMPSSVEAFARALFEQLPPLATVTTHDAVDLPASGETTFRIRASRDDASRRPEVTPDAATCGDCVGELTDRGDRRYRYPFINCTNCGPRYSIIRDVPYDRPQTTMAVFRMCPACQREYDDPADRRFHAQPNACPACGPQLTLRVVRRVAGEQPGVFATTGDPLDNAARLLDAGAILAVKGIGGFHLACRADDEAVVARLRQRKLRDGKPLAVMVADLATARRLCHLGRADEAVLRSAAAPIVLAPKRPDAGLAGSIAPGCGDYGLMLPYAPVHHLLFGEGLGPLVMTSANLAGEPLTYRDADALASLADVADGFLFHDREIFRPIDDSVVLTFRKSVVSIRRARGYAPQPVQIGAALPAVVRDGEAPEILAVGGELKSTVCLLRGGGAIVSEHLGDLTRPETFRHFVGAIERLKQLYAFEPELVACDMHPRYMATAYARQLGLPVVAVQHHHAHVASVMAEHGESGPVIGLACDGTGHGVDGAVWGCEVLLCEGGAFERLAHLEYFPLVGGDQAALETWRPAAALLRQIDAAGWRAGLVPPRDGACRMPDEAGLRVFEQQARRAVNAPPTSSLGRVFDALGFVLGLCERNRHEAEAAMAVEAAAGAVSDVVEPLAYSVHAGEEGMRMSLGPALREALALRDAGESAGVISARFHEAVARVLTDVAVAAARRRGVTGVVLSGGCFANRRLLGRAVALLEAAGLRVLLQRVLPCGDGGIALGQALVAAYRAGGMRRREQGTGNREQKKGRRGEKGTEEGTEGHRDGGTKGGKGNRRRDGGT
jgi:hydrogenase maturation protein HypF